VSNNLYYTDAQLQAELDRCLYCAEKPCLDGCPASCSPADFIMAAKQGQKQDIARSASEILQANPMGESCGAICPDAFCMKACSRAGFDNPINIPKLQATIVHNARMSGAFVTPEKPAKNGKKVAVIGAGPAGIAAVAVLARKGYEVTIFDDRAKAGGAASLIPEERLPEAVIQRDFDYAMSLGHTQAKFNTEVKDPAKLLGEGFDAVLVSVGEPESTTLGVDGDKDNSIAFTEYLKDASKYATNGAVAIIGGGAVAVDCASEAKKHGARQVEMFVRRTVGEMRLTGHERQILLDNLVDITTRTRVMEVKAEDGKKTLVTCKTTPPENHVAGQSLLDIEGTKVDRKGFDHVIMAIGGKQSYLGGWKLVRDPKNEAVFYGGDCVHGGSTAVEAVASGKNAAAEIDAYLSGAKVDEKIKALSTKVTQKAKSRAIAEGVMSDPVDISTDFFGFPMSSPFLLSAAPHTDGFDQMKLAYEAGWAGGVMKTAFDGLDVHIPAGYMFAYTKDTFANCDNVSDHPLDRVCAEVRELRRLYPEKLTMASTGGPVTGDDENDKKGWQSNTKKLEEAGCVGLEYSLSCPQGGDGTEGDIVSQNAKITQKVIEWILEAGDPNIPKLFKLTGAVTSVVPIIKAVQRAMDKYPNSKAGITLANSFPSMTFRPHLDETDAKWEEGIIAGMSGEGVLPISYLSLANAGNYGVFTSGNGGPMNYMHAANFLALGAKNVQFCSIAMKHGVGIINELNSGLSHLLKVRGMKSVSELIGCALPKPVTDFPDLTPVKRIPTVNPDLCMSCGNCTNCGYQAIELNEKGIPEFDASKCVGCTFCTKMCFAGALSMRERTEEELALCHNI
jgi:dihydropyrimidine dehydrogenase (NAD+) subunit PreT